MMRNRFLQAFIAIVISFTCHAQNSFVATGGNASGTGGTSSFSVGQISYKNPNGSLISDGVQQPYEISVLGTENFEAILQIAAYPNPTTDVLHLTIDTIPENASWALFDSNGKSMAREVTIRERKTSVPMKIYASGVYILSLYSKNQLLKSFKIIKK